MPVDFRMFCQTYLPPRGSSTSNKEVSNPALTYIGIQVAHAIIVLFDRHHVR
jgi:hypothetical protein